jgi:hypothetical protein
MVEVDGEPQALWDSTASITPAGRMMIFFMQSVE